MHTLKKFLSPLTPLKGVFNRVLSITQNLTGIATRDPNSNLSRLIVEPLSDRELIRVQGEEVVPFLQGLITNDMRHLETGHSIVNNAGSMYAMFLNKAGRILFDSIIYCTKDPNTYLIECDKNISTELRRHLRLYRVRRKIDIDAADNEYRPWIVFNPDDGDVRFDSARLSNEVQFTNDPRIRELGMRLITTADRNWMDVAKIFSEANEISVTPPSNEYNYRKRRYTYGVGEGVVDLPPGKCFPLEANGDYLHGVSFQKGCYIGQELTARVYHTGTIRKRFMPLRLTAPIPKNVTTVQSQAGSTVGTIRSSNENRALALLRVEQALNSSKLLIDGEVCYVEKPKWWPAELPNKTRLRD